MFRQKIVLIVIPMFAAAVAGGFFAGVFFEQALPSDLAPNVSREQSELGTAPQGVRFSTFWDAWNMIEANFMGAATLDRKRMEYGAASGLAESLQDPYTEFLDPEAAKRLRESVVSGAALPSVEWRLMDDSIAYIKLFRFTSKAMADFKEVGQEILENSAEKIILDLRDNPGGSTDAFISIAGWFFKEGETIATESFGKGRGERVYKSQGEGGLRGYPTVIVINAKTASVAEVFANVMQESRGVVLVGEASMGKGSVQKLLTLSGDAALRLTTSELLSPKGNPVSKSGLKPDIEVGRLEGEKDVQLEKALLVFHDERR